MQQRWNLNIEKFAKIDKASIEISQLMILVGDNNSGKSYVMALFWGIVAYGYKLFDYDLSNLSTYKKCDQWFEEHVKSETTIDNEAEQLFVDFFNELLHVNKKNFLNHIFNYNVKAGKIFVSNYKRKKKFQIKWNDERKAMVSNSEINLDYEQMKINPGLRQSALKSICWSLIMDDITIPVPFESTSKQNSPIYLPASRTGFMLTYKKLADKSIGNEFTMNINDNSKKSVLPLPVLSFLQDLISLEITNKSKYKSIANFIEGKILNGTIKADKSPITNFLYTSSDLDLDIPLYVTSSLVTELAPIILFLKSNKKYNLMVIEEPEAHLHLQMQRIMARAIVRMSNSKLPIWITTHSDTILQQINNLIKLNNHPDKDALAIKYGYEKEDFLNPSNVKVYQFNVGDDGKTNVTPLELSDSGFEVPTFNNTIFELSKETIEFEGETIC